MPIPNVLAPLHEAQSYATSPLTFKYLTPIRI